MGEGRGPLHSVGESNSSGFLDALCVGESDSSGLGVHSVGESNISGVMMNTKGAS